MLCMPDTPISGCTTGQQFTDVNSDPTMGFSKTIKEKTLVAAGRRCCLCTRYKGVRLEVHHIVPTSDGGTDDYDNAIALCFDCHADVGHYNPHHPRGNRFTPTELREHRRRLYRQIKSGTLSSTPPQEHWAYCRYLICKSFSALSENHQRRSCSPSCRKSTSGRYHRAGQYPSHSSRPRQRHSRKQCLRRPVSRCGVVLCQAFLRASPPSLGHPQPFLLPGDSDAGGG